jgi:hypothetical protein
MGWLILIGGVILLFGVTALTGAPYVPSQRRELRRAFRELYPVSTHDFLVDIGAGDGVVLRVAREFGAKGIGYELNPLLVLIARLLITDVKLANMWTVAFPERTTVVYTFGDSRDIKKMYTKVQREATRLMRPLAFITYGFEVPGEVAERSFRAYHLYQVSPLSE